MSEGSPRFHLTRVYSDGTEERPEIVRVRNIPLSTLTSRRGFFATAGITAVGASSAALAGQNRSPAGEGICQETTQIDGEGIFLGCDRLVRAHLEITYSVAYSSNGGLLASAAFGTGRGSIKLWDMPEGQLLSTIRDDEGSTCVRLSPDGTTLATGGFSGSIVLRDVPSGRMLTTIQAHTYSLGSLVFGPGGAWLASSRVDEGLKFWSTSDGHEVFPLGNREISAWSVVTSADGMVLAAVTRGQAVKIWSVHDGSEIATLAMPRGWIASLALSPDGAYLAAGFGNEGPVIELWRIRDRHLLGVLRGHDGQVTSLAFSPDGRRLASGSNTATSEKIIRIWNVSEAVLYRTHRVGDSIVDLEFAPDGALAVATTFHIAILRPDGVVTCLFDPAALERREQVNQYRRDFANGQWLTHTQPCGSPIPPGASCTCNCVAGTYSPPTSSGGSGGGRYCTCNQVCVCIPVCQAHRLLDGDSFVRAMAASLVRRIAAFDSDYIRWAAQTAPMPLRDCIAHIVGERQSAHADHAFPRDRCFAYLDHPDEVTRIMAAQHLALGGATALLAPDKRARVHALLRRAESLHWRNRARLGT